MDRFDIAVQEADSFKWGMETGPKRRTYNRPNIYNLNLRFELRLSCISRADFNFRQFR